MSNKKVRIQSVLEEDIVKKASKIIKRRKKTWNVSGSKLIKEALLFVIENDKKVK